MKLDKNKTYKRKKAKNLITKFLFVIIYIYLCSFMRSHDQHLIFSSQIAVYAYFHLQDCKRK